MYYTRFNLLRAINQGLLPSHYLHAHPERLIKAYVNEYIQEEIIQEAQIRKLRSFVRFLEISALMNGELLNYANVGRDCGISPKTVREYYDILSDTLLGFALSPWMKIKTRKLIETQKYYLFDTAIIRHLRGIAFVPERTIDFGNLFETLMINQVRAYLAFSNSHLKIFFWRTTSGFEVDLIVSRGDQIVAAIEFKSNTRVSGQEVRSMKAFLEEHKPDFTLIVSRESTRRKLVSGILVVPEADFLKNLWKGTYF